MQVVNYDLPTTLGISKNGDSTVTVLFSGTAGGQYWVQASSNLSLSAAWTNVATNTAGTDGRWTFKDSMTNDQQRFYRSARP
jgi:hypothetical protein